MQGKEKTTKSKTLVKRYLHKKSSRIFFLSLLAVTLSWVGYLVFANYDKKNSSNDTTKELLNLDSKKVTELAQKANCNETISTLSNMKTDDSYPLDSGNMLTLRASCYSELKNYDNAINDYNEAKKIWKNLDQKDRVGLAEKSIKYNEKLKKNPAVNEKTSTYSAEDELDPEFIKELEKAENNND